MTEREIVSALLYGTISIIVAYAWIFLFASEYVKIKQGYTTGIEAVGKVTIFQILIVFVFIMLFSGLDIFLPQEFKVSKALSSFWSSSMVDDENIYQYWLDQMKSYSAMSPIPKEKYFASMIVFYELLGLYILDLLTPFLMLGGSIFIIFKSEQGRAAESSFVLKGAKAFMVFVGLVLSMYIYTMIGSASIQGFLPSSESQNFNLYHQMNKHLSLIFKV